MTFIHLLTDPWAPHPVVNRHVCNGGGDAPGPSTTQLTNQTTQAPEAIEGSLKNLSQQYFQGFLDNPNAPDFFPGATTAGFSPQTEAALTGMYNRGAGGSDVQRAGVGNVQDTLTGKYLDIKNNPYFQGALEAGFRPQTEQFMNQVVPGLDSRFAGAGRYAGGAHFDTTGQAVTSLNRAQADAAAKASLGAYEGERGRQMTALNALPQFQAADYADLQSMLGAGGARDVQKQKEIDEAIARYTYEQNKQRDFLVNTAQGMQAIYPGGATSGTSSGGATRGGGGGNSAQSWIGTGTAVAGLGLSIAGII